MSANNNDKYIEFIVIIKKNDLTTTGCQVIFVTQTYKVTLITSQFT